ncbi:MAG: hypothetical protein JJ992_14930, partial [Planctomycetes bacterium]|nr:hypothetical protein [Planctomycetota bacterium]
TDLSTLAGALPASLLVTGTGLDDIEVRLGNAADTFTVNATAARATVKTGGGTDTVHVETAAGGVAIYGQGSVDTVNIKSIGAVSEVHGGGGSDYVTIGNDAHQVRDIGGPLSVYGDEGQDEIHIDNRGADTQSLSVLTDTYFESSDMTGGGRVVYNSVATLDIDLGDEIDTVRVEGLAAGTTAWLNTEGGPDQVTIGDANSRTAAVQGILHLDTGADLDTLTYDDSGNGSASQGAIADGLLTNVGIGDIHYQGVEDLLVRYGDHGNLVTVTGGADLTTQIQLGDAENTLTIDDSTAALTVIGGAAIDHLNLLGMSIGDSSGTVLLRGGSGSDIFLIDVNEGSRGLVTVRGEGGNDDQLIYSGREDINDFIQLDTVYVRDEDNAKSFTEDRWTGYGTHGDGLIISHFDSTVQGYDPVSLDDTESLGEIHASTVNVAGELFVLNYGKSGFELLNIFGRSGDDRFVVDDTAAVIDLYGEEGNDSFFVGSILKTQEVFVEGEEITIVDEVTKGTSQPMNIYGGENDDYFEVNRTASEIALFKCSVAK